MKVVFFGTPTFAVPTLERLLASTLDVVAVVTQPDRPRGRGHRVTDSPAKQVAGRHEIHVLQPQRLKDQAFMERLTALAPDLGVVAAYGKILPDQLLALPRLGMINVHASLLPKYRGAAPIHRAVMAGETETGVTIIQLVREMDAGPMLRKATRPIGPDVTSDLVERDLATVGADLLMRTIEDLATGHASSEAQDHAVATFAPRLTKDDGVIDWGKSAKAIHDQVRGLHPWPHAFSCLDDHRYLILRTAATETAAATTRQARPVPGQVVEASGDRLVVATGLAVAIAILEIQPEGKRPLPARAFLAGHRIRVGAMFHSSIP